MIKIVRLIEYQDNSEIVLIDSGVISVACNEKFLSDYRINSAPTISHKQMRNNSRKCLQLVNTIFDIVGFQHEKADRISANSLRRAIMFDVININNPTFYAGKKLLIMKLPIVG